MLIKSNCNYLFPNIFTNNDADNYGLLLQIKLEPDNLKDTF